jgi:DHA2 family multidrug resistance protein
VGGWITDHYNWHWLFFINLLPGIFITLTVPRLVRIDLPDWSLFRRADYPGILLMSLFLGCLEYTLEEGPRWDWMSDPVIATTAWVAAVSGVLFVWRSLAAAEPVVDLRALKERNFALGCFFSFVTGIGIFATIYLTPLFLGRVRGLCAADRAGGVFHRAVPDHVHPALCLADTRFELRWIMMIGLALFALSMWQFVPITHDWGWAQLLLPQACAALPSSWRCRRQ